MEKEYAVRQFPDDLESGAQQATRDKIETFVKALHS
jgi:hypothetical protein